MTLDECITYFEEQSKEHTKLVPYDIDEKYNKNCRQLAEWLRELKDYREAWSQFGETLTELKNYNTYDNPDVDDVCKFLVNYKNVLERQIKNKEVNADESVMVALDDIAISTMMEIEDAPAIIEADRGE